MGIIIFSILCTAGFIIFYFFLLPRILIKHLARFTALESPEYSGWLYPDEYMFTARGEKNNHSIEISFRQHFIIPHFEIEIRHIDNTVYNFNFLETYDKDFLKYRDKNYLYKKVLDIFIFHKTNRNNIIRLTNQKLRNTLINFLINKFIVDIYDTHISLKYKIIFTYLILFFRRKFIKKTIDEALVFSEKLLRKKDEEFLIENINSEDHTGLKTINLMLLFNKGNLSHNNKLFKQYENDRNRIMSIIAQCGLKKEEYTDLEYILKRDNQRDIIFILENMPRFIIKNQKKIDLLSYVLERYNNYFIYTQAIDSLVKIDARKGEEIVYEFIMNNRKPGQFISVDYDYLIRIIGENRYKKCYDFVISHLDDEDEDTVAGAIETLAKIGEVNAVEFLLPLTKGMRSMKIKTAARKAIKELQKGIPLETKGGLSLIDATDEEGLLSLYDDEKKDEVDKEE